jgi:hypothetical protein
VLLDRAWLEWCQERQDREQRVALMVPLRYQHFATAPLGQSWDEATLPEASPGNGTGMTSNISNGGLCLLLDWVPQERTVFRVEMPVRDGSTNIPTIAEVRWVRPIPLGLTGVCAVGMKFLV